MLKVNALCAQAVRGRTRMRMRAWPARRVVSLLTTGWRLRITLPRRRVLFVRRANGLHKVLRRVRRVALENTWKTWPWLLVHMRWKTLARFVRLEQRLDQGLLYASIALLGSTSRMTVQTKEATMLQVIAPYARAANFPTQVPKYARIAPKANTLTTTLRVSRSTSVLAHARCAVKESTRQAQGLRRVRIVWRVCT